MVPDSASVLLSTVLLLCYVVWCMVCRVTLAYAREHFPSFFLLPSSLFPTLPPPQSFHYFPLHRP
ncbi:uncharacterized protein BDV14DRAFT_49414 [Aspergillus stella-maris]|uniref:uncharacterized protein n=1 Tax=Aspergillus stella-maris TaxID=1810926 RepID=UPI003CCE1486